MSARSVSVLFGWLTCAAGGLTAGLVLDSVFAGTDGHWEKAALLMWGAFGSAVLAVLFGAACNGWDKVAVASEPSP